MYNAMRKMRWVTITMLTCCFMWVIDVDRWRVVFEIQRAEAQELQTQQSRRDMQTDFDTKLGELQMLLERLADEVASDSECEATYTEIIQKRDTILASFRETNASLDAMEAKLVQLGIESKIARLRQVRDEIQIKSERVFADLMAIEGKYKNISPVLGVYKTDEIIATRTELIGICRQLAEFLSQNRQEPLHQPLGRDLPHGGMTFEPVTPTLGTESNGLVAGGRIQLPVGVERFSSPTSADLAATSEIQINDKIRELAANLHNNPREIYYHVLNNYDFQPYYGSLKGSEGVRLEGIGNDIDLASFTMALLRASNVPCRYVYGLVEIPIESVMSWLMVEKPEVAVEILQTKTGIPTAVRMEGNKIVSVQIEHVWLEARVRATPWHDISSEDSEYRWIPMDVSFKHHSTTWGSIGINNADINGQINSALMIIGNNDVVQGVNQDSLASIINGALQQIPNDTDSIDSMFATIGKREIQQISEGNGLPITLAGRQTVQYVHGVYSSIPKSLCHSVEFSITSPNFNCKTEILSVIIPGNAIMIGAEAASSEDAKLLTSLLTSGDTNISLPAFIVNLVPMIFVDGVPLDERQL